MKNITFWSNSWSLIFNFYFPAAVARTNKDIIHTNSYAAKTVCFVYSLLYKNQCLHENEKVKWHNNKKQQKHRYNFYYETAMENALLWLSDLSLSNTLLMYIQKSLFLLEWELTLYFPVLDIYLKPLLRKTLFTWDQNQTVDDIGIHMIQKVYIEKINKARFHFVIGDEFAFSSNEILAVSKWVSYSSEVSLLSFYFLLKNDKEGLLFIRLRLGSANLPEFLFTVTLVVSCNQHKPARLHCGCCEVFERRVMVHWRHAAN